MMQITITLSPVNNDQLDRAMTGLLALQDAIAGRSGRLASQAPADAAPAATSDEPAPKRRGPGRPRKVRSDVGSAAPPNRSWKIRVEPTENDAVPDEPVAEEAALLTTEQLAARLRPALDLIGVNAVREVFAACKVSKMSDLLTTKDQQKFLAKLNEAVSLQS